MRRIVFQVIEHFEQEKIEKILNECNRLLKDDGRLIVTVPHVFSISAFIDPTHKSFFTFGSGKYWDIQSSKVYYKSLKAEWKLKKTSCKVLWFDWKGYQLKKLDKLFSKIIELRLNNILKSYSTPIKADRIVKKSSFHYVEIKWTFVKS